MKLFSFVVFTLFSYSFFAQADNSSISISDAKIYAPLQGTNATAGYGTITNTSNKTVVVKVEKVDGFKATELHESLEKDGRMSMQKVEAIKIEAKKSFDLKPGGYHIMLFDPTKKFKEGEMVSVTLNVDGKSFKQEFKIVPRLKKQEDHSHH